jgi:hypothetical protein
LIHLKRNHLETNSLKCQTVLLTRQNPLKK